MTELNSLEKTLGYKFKDQSLLRQALVHSSCTSDLDKNYERLEFLGDRVLGVAIAYLLYNKFEQDTEGSLSQRHVSLVNKDNVAETARHLGLGKYITIMNEDIRDNDNVLCDVCEAVVGAIYLDGGYEKALKFVSENWDITKDRTPPKDCKTTLQELTHVKSLGSPSYCVVKREGSEHEPIFHVAVSVKSCGETVGVGKNKKMAEQEAASLMIEKINDNE
ncbi:MAG: ribonuclease III [Lactobacillus sp.]|nr:ribonuclease III [Lactobacillus sp.]